MLIEPYKLYPTSVLYFGLVENSFLAEDRRMSTTPDIVPILVEHGIIELIKRPGAHYFKLIRPDLSKQEIREIIYKHVKRRDKKWPHRLILEWLDWYKWGLALTIVTTTISTAL